MSRAILLALVCHNFFTSACYARCPPESLRLDRLRPQTRSCSSRRADGSISASLEGKGEAPNSDNANNASELPMKQLTSDKQAQSSMFVDHSSATTSDAVSS